MCSLVQVLKQVQFQLARSLIPAWLIRALPLTYTCYRRQQVGAMCVCVCVCGTGIDWIHVSSSSLSRYAMDCQRSPFLLRLRGNSLSIDWENHAFVPSFPAGGQVPRTGIL